jgi:cytochrome c oxidase subunit IV
MMRAYVAVTGMLFVLVAISHVVRIFAEKDLLRDVGFIVLTILLLVLAGWAGTLLRKNPASTRSKEEA